jgi:CRISPR system Cascade subunit CasB
MTEQLESTGGPAPQESSLASVIGRLAQAMDKTLSPGDLADLRRLTPQNPYAPAFWKLVVNDAGLEAMLPVRDEARDEAERRWGAILQGLATLGRFHTFGVGLGRALAEAGFAELRFVRLLRAHDEGLLDQARITARFLSAKGQPGDWTDMAWLILSDGRGHEEKVRRRLARDYYRHLKA